MTEEPAAEAEKVEKAEVAPETEAKMETESADAAPAAAEEVKMGVFDRVFTRVGASDNLSTGESTFMVEMAETEFIWNCARSSSFLSSVASSIRARAERP